jgi:hypothetical protein
MHVAHHIGAAKTAQCRTAVKAGAGIAAARKVALKQYRTSRIARAMLYGLRAFDDGDLVEGGREYVSGRRVHAAAASAQYLFAIQQDVQARAGHAAKHRIAIGAAFAYHRKTGNGLQVFRTVVRGDRLARLARIGGHHQRLLHRRRCDHHFRQHVIGGERAGREGQRDTNSYTLELHCSSPCK